MKILACKESPLEVFVALTLKSANDMPTDWSAVHAACTVLSVESEDSCQPGSRLYSSVLRHWRVR